MNASTVPIALVTGGASGIGREVVARLRDAGHHVVVWDLADADIICDVSDPDAVSAAMEQTVRDHGVPTRVVTSAGIGSSGQLLKLPPAEWDRVLAINLTGTWLCIRAAAQAMVDADVGGSMVAVSSISGSVADRDMGAYCVSKAGVDMLVKVAAVEWGTHGIRVNSVGPGVTRTPMLPNLEAWPGWADGLSRRTALGRLGEASDVAGAIVGVLELPWVTGQLVHADGGLALHSPIDAYGQVERLMRLKKLRELRDQRESAEKLS
ncbi:SDR family NAD(P)-dependent oxidoreductase [Mycobacterium simiae]|uniref:SDR family NAD(P)-dependent oxidoreductase n=1 Tax=Mycobacterium simiae TaxID=1784 RepID=UPI0021CD7337|nr:SDR family oxidoreductase [Mycobacterium simiae]